MRKCTVSTKEGHYTAYFHHFYVHSDVIPPSISILGDQGGQFSHAKAIVENAETGAIDIVFPCAVTFIDPPKQ